jgi:hypothetical protein
MLTRRSVGFVLCQATLLVFIRFAFGAPSGKELLEALRDGRTADVRRLIAARAPIDAADEVGSSALMYAALYSDAEVMRRLLDRGADPNHADESGATALMWAASDAVKVRLLLDHGADVNAASKAGRTALLRTRPWLRFHCSRPESGATHADFCQSRDWAGRSCATRLSLEVCGRAHA